jgi:hypothetical protein
VLGAPVAVGAGDMEAEAGEGDDDPSGSDTWSSSSLRSFPEIAQVAPEPTKAVEPPKPVEAPPKTNWKSAPFPVRYVQPPKSKTDLPTVEPVEPPAPRQKPRRPHAHPRHVNQQSDTEPEIVTETHHGRTILWLLLAVILFGLAALSYLYPDWHLEVPRRWAEIRQSLTHIAAPNSEVGTRALS